MISELVTVFGILLFVLATTIICYLKWIHQYWKRRKFPYMEPSILFLNAILMRLNAGIKLQRFYEIGIRRNLKFIGIYVFHMPRLLIICPKLIENMLQKDFSHFTDRGFYFNERDDPLSANLFAIGGEKWRTVRHKLSSSFTLGKLKVMFPILKKCGMELKDIINVKCINNQAVDVMDIASSYTINVIASCGFGVDCNSFLEDSEFKKQGKMIFNLHSCKRLLKFAFAFTCTNAARKCGVTLFERETTIFFTNLLKNTVKFRREHGIVRHDMIHSIMELGSSFDDDSIKEMAAQVFVFFAAGYETSSITLTFCLYELSINSDCQKEARKEINEVLKRHGDEITYETLKEMKYMDQVINETLRKYPPLLYISRLCVKDYVIPDTENIISEGTSVDISILGLHHNRNYFPDPNKFDPARFSKDKKYMIEPSTYIPFGAGPRKCIGMQLGLLNIKMALTMLLHRHSFSLHENTRQPMEYDYFSFTLIPKHKILLNVKPSSRSD